MAVFLFNCALDADTLIDDEEVWADEAWRYACQSKRYSCKGLARPLISYQEMTGMSGLYIHGTHEILINFVYRGDEYARYVMVHEMVHYIQNAQGYMDLFADTFRHPCDREREAFDIEYQIAQEAGYSHPFVQPWATAKANYECE